MTPPSAIEPNRFFDFIGNPAVTLVFVSVHPMHSFNEALAHHLTDAEPHQAPVAIGVMDFATLMLSGTAVLPFLQRELASCGAPVVTVGIVAGYCLFRGGEMLAWESGLPSMADATDIARSAIVGAVFSGFTGNLAYVGHAARRAVDEVAARRMASSFRLAAAQPAGQRRAASSESSSGSSSSRSGWSGWAASEGGARDDEDLFWAYRTLGVSPSASDDQVRDGWRKKRVESHPDLAAQDPAEFQRRSRVAADVNRAREVIFGHRRRGGAQRATA